MSTPTPVPVTPSFAVTNVSSSSGGALSPALPLTVKVTFQPYFAASANGQTDNVPFGNSIDTSWNTNDPTTIQVTAQGQPVTMSFADIANAVAAVSAYALNLQLNPPAPPSS